VIDEKEEQRILSSMKHQASGVRDISGKKFAVDLDEKLRIQEFKDNQAKL
jgi:hypothetical protein